MKDTGQKKFGVLIDGPEVSPLGMMMVSEYPERISHLVLINPESAGAAYGNALDNVRRYGMRVGNKEVVKGVDGASMMQDGNPKYKASDSAELGGMNRALRNLRFADPTEPETGAMEYFYRLPGSYGMNDDKWSTRALVAKKKLSFPVLIFMGEKSPFSLTSDMQVVSGIFKQAVVVKLPDAGEMPFMSDTYAFTKHMEKFFQGAKAPEKAKEEAEEKKEKGKTTVAK